MPQPPVLDHLIRLSDDVGIIQHAVEDIPNRSTGYCTDDVARAFIVAVIAMNCGAYDRNAKRLAGTYLSFLFDAQRPDGRFHNFMGYDRNWQDDRGSDDSFGRAFWAAGFGMRRAAPDSWRRICEKIVERALPHLAEPAPLRSHAYAALGLIHAIASGNQPERFHSTLAGCLETIRSGYREHASLAWRWCEQTMTYDNARLCEALIAGGVAVGDGDAIDVGLKMLDFYASLTIEDGMFVPVGNDGWHTRGGVRARFGQQPLEAAALIDASLAAHAYTSDSRYLTLAESGYEWFLGRNTHRVSLVLDGGCCDGIDRGGANLNRGAESTLAYLAGALAWVQRGAAPLRIAR